MLNIFEMRLFLEPLKCEKVVCLNALKKPFTSLLSFHLALRHDTQRQYEKIKDIRAQFPIVGVLISDSISLL